MKKQIELDNRKVNYVLKESKRAKRMRLTIYRAGDFVVTKPFKLSEDLVEEFIRQKSNWILSKLEYIKRFKNSSLLRNDKNHFLKHKEEALKLISGRVDYYNGIYGFDFNKISIKNQKTRWGSCSKKKNLNFNYRILFLPKKIADYVIIHELFHLKEFNHSKEFWNLVAGAMPDYLEIKKELRKIKI